MSEFDKGALRYVFPEELLRYFDIVESGIHTDKPGLLLNVLERFCMQIVCK